MASDNKHSREITKTSIRQLHNIIDVESDPKRILTASWNCLTLTNPQSSDVCQVLECVSTGKDEFMELHQHPVSGELFYQVRGTTQFRDGRILKEREYFYIPKGVQHSPKLSPDGICIVIVHPLESEYPRGSHDE